MNEITGLQNPIVKEITALHQKKHRAESGMFLIEGFKGVKDALKYGLKVKYIFINKDSKRNTEENSSDNLIYHGVRGEAPSLSPPPPLREGAGGGCKNLPLNTSQHKLYFVDEKILKKISTTETPPEIVAVAFQLKFELKDMFKEKNPLIIVLENIKDAGNLGTIVRTAKAANVSGIVLTGECIDIYNPKVVRASAANLWKIPVVYFKETKNLRKELEKFAQLQFLATKVDESADKGKQAFYDKINYNQPTVVMFGSEAEGISDILANYADKFIKIPMNSDVESLNLSVSAGIIMYEAFKQKSFKL